MELRVGVKILLKNREGKYLVLKRSEEKYPEVEKQWDIPGGRIDPGATLVENLVREVMEETGLKVESEPRLLFAQDIIKQDKGKHVVRLTYLGEADGKVVLSDEHTGFQWLSLAEIARIPELDRYFREVLERKLV